jgi:deoxycytidylate deaminase
VRRKTGALVMDFYDGVPMIVGSGCNGGPPGGTNECETGPCLSLTKQGIIHAEVNAMNSLPLKSSTRIMFCTDSPCAPCLDKMEADGTIDLMVFVREYRISDHLQTSKIPWVVVDQDAVIASMHVAVENMGKVIST